jgi:hypothetical protein
VRPEVLGKFKNHMKLIHVGLYQNNYFRFFTKMLYMCAASALSTSLEQIDARTRQHTSVVRSYDNIEGKVKLSL